MNRDLDCTELRDLVARIAAEPEQWQGLVRHGTPERHFEQLWRDDHVDVWVITWTDGNDTGFHDHDVSRGAVAVVEGEVTEERLVVGGPPRRLRHAAGETFEFDASHVHRMWLRRRRARRVDPRLLAAAVAYGRLHGRSGRHPAPRVGVVRGGAAPGRRRRGVAPGVSASHLALPAAAGGSRTRMWTMPPSGRSSRVTASTRWRAREAWAWSTGRPTSPSTGTSPSS